MTIEEFKRVLGIILTTENAVSIGTWEVDVFKYVFPGALFIGEPDEVRDGEIDEIPENGWSEFIHATLETLADGYNVDLQVESSTSVGLITALDCLYGVLLQCAAPLVTNEGALPVGKLTIHADGEWGKNLRSLIDCVGGEIMNGLSVIIDGLAQNGNSKAILLAQQISDSAAYFLPFPNVDKLIYEEDGDLLYNSAANYDLGFGGIFGWYRVEKALKYIGIRGKGFLSILESEEIAMQKKLSGIYLDGRDISIAGSEMLSASARKEIEDAVKLFKTIYEVKS